MNAATYMEQIANIRAKIQNKLDEIERLKLLSTDMSVTLSPVKVSSSPNPHRLSNIWDRMIDFQAELMDEINYLADKEKEIISTIEMLPTNEYQVLYGYYVKGYTIESLAAKMYCSASSIGRYKKDGLNRLQMILNDRVQ